MNNQKRRDGETKGIMIKIMIKIKRARRKRTRTNAIHDNGSERIPRAGQAITRRMLCGRSRGGGGAELPVVLGRGLLNNDGVGKLWRGDLRMAGFELSPKWPRKGLEGNA